MGRSRSCINAMVFVTLASCATTGARTENNASLEASRESERAARAAGAEQRRSEQTRASGEIRALLLRESSAPLAPRQVRIGEDYQGTVEGTAEPTLRAQQGSTMVIVAIGASEPMQCVISEEEEDQANKLYAVYQRVRERFSATQVALIDAGATHGNRYVDLHFSYRVGTGASASVGYMKMRSLTTGDRSALCMHDELGYSQTFHRATLPLLATRSSDARRRSFVLSINRQRIGTMSVSSIERDAQRVDVTGFSMLLARTAQDLMANDGVDVERSLENGELTERVTAESENGALETKRWQRQDRSLRYAFEGTHLGRPLNGVVTARAPLRSDSAEIRALVRNGVVGRSPAIERDALNGSNPLVLTTQRTELVRRVDAQHVWVNIATARRTMRALIDDQGLPSEAELTIGQLTLRVEQGSEP